MREYLEYSRHSINVCGREEGRKGGREEGRRKEEKEEALDLEFTYSGGESKPCTDNFSSR